MGKPFLPQLPFDVLARAEDTISPAALSTQPAAAPDSSPVAVCDPSRPESHPLHHILATIGHPSAASLASIAALRERHMMKGHTPAADAAHGPAYFKRLSDEAFRDALNARAPETRRKRLITAAAILIAMIDAEDFTARQQEPSAP